MKKISIYSVILFLAMIFPAFAAPPAPPVVEEIVIATGKSAGTYHKIFTDIAAAVSSPPLRAIPDGDSITNLEMLMNNKCNLAFVQMDILFAKKMIENDPEIDSVKTFMTLYPAEVHFITAANNSYINKFSDLGNKRIGVFGGANYSIKVLVAKTGVRPIQITEYPDPKTLVAALASGNVDAIVAAGGQPIEWVRSLDRSYKFVPFDRFDQVKDVYSRSVLDYSNMTGSGAATVAVQSLIVTLDYKTKKRVESLSNFRKTLFANIDEIRETTGSHKKWRVINPRDKGAWQYFEGVKK